MRGVWFERTTTRPILSLFPKFPGSFQEADLSCKKRRERRTGKKDRRPSRPPKTGEGGKPDRPAFEKILQETLQKKRPIVFEPKRRDGTRSWRPGGV